jgi:ABC-type hemin transport system substrate-binding protein
MMALTQPTRDKEAVLREVRKLARALKDVKSSRAALDSLEQQLKAASQTLDEATDVRPRRDVIGKK